MALTNKSEILSQYFHYVLDKKNVPNLSSHNNTVKLIELITEVASKMITEKICETLYDAFVKIALSIHRVIIESSLLFLDPEAKGCRIDKKYNENSLLSTLEEYMTDNKEFINYCISKEIKLMMVQFIKNFNKIYYPVNGDEKISSESFADRIGEINRLYGTSIYAITFCKIRNDKITPKYINLANVLL